MLDLWLTVGGAAPRGFSQHLHHFTFTSGRHEGSKPSTSLPALVFCLFSPALLGALSWRLTVVVFCVSLTAGWTSQVALVVKNPPANASRPQRCRFNPLFGKVPLEEGMATHSSILAWRIPRNEEPGGLLSMGSPRVGHDWGDYHTRLVMLKMFPRACLLVICRPFLEKVLFRSFPVFNLGYLSVTEF